MSRARYAAMTLTELHNELASIKSQLSYGMLGNRERLNEDYQDVQLEMLMRLYLGGELAETNKAIKALSEERVAEKAAVVAEFGETKKKLALFAETVPLLTSDIVYNPFAATDRTLDRTDSKLSIVMIAVAGIALWWFFR